VGCTHDFWSCFNWYEKDMRLLRAHHSSSFQVVRYLVWLKFMRIIQDSLKARIFILEKGYLKHQIVFMIIIMA